MSDISTIHFESEVNNVNMKTKNCLIKKGSLETIPMPEVNAFEPAPRKALGSKKRFAEAVQKVQKELSVRERYNLFIGETSFTVITKIHKATSIVKKIIWILVLFAMLSWLSIQCYWLFEKYFSYPVEVKIETKASPVMEFPSITFCNRNPLKQSKLFDPNSPFRSQGSKFSLVTDTQLYDKATEMFKESDTSSEEVQPQDNSNSHRKRPSRNRIIYNSTMSPTGNNTHTIKDWMEEMKKGDFNKWDALSDPDTAAKYYQGMDQECQAGLLYSTIAATTEEEEMKQYGHSERDFIMSCKYAGYKCSPANFTFLFNYKYGNCYTFNSFDDPNPVVKANFAGPLMGLVVEFNIEQYEYINALAPDAGVRIIIHDRGTYPFPEDDGFSVPPGLLTSVGMTKISHERLPPPHANCSNYPKREDWYVTKYNVNYNKKTCLKSCWQERVLSMCGCAVPIYLVPNNSAICDFSNVTISKCMTSAIDTFASCDVECPETCKENVYELSLSAAQWPSDKYENFLDDRLKKSNSMYMRGEVESEANLAKLEIFYKDLSYEEVKQQKAYESQNLISDVGGQLGLWLGLSAITIGEFLEFFMAMFKSLTAGAVRRRHQQTAVKEINPTDLQGE